MQYAYIRVSSVDQNIERQLSQILEYQIDKKNVFIDRLSGKDFNRSNYQRLLKKLKKDDLLIIKSIDRLGRNYKMIIEQWDYITNKIGADILVLDMPLLDTRTTSPNLVGRFISDIVLQVLSFVAENERENIRQRQAEGIKIAKEKGIHLGRPKYLLPHNFRLICSQYTNCQITIDECLTILQMKKSTFYKYFKLLNNIIN